MNSTFFCILNQEVWFSILLKWQVSGLLLGFSRGWEEGRPVTEVWDLCQN